MKLSEYKKKRDFSKTPEPKGDQATKSAASLFVVQEHHASRLHYDFRLKIGRTLKSWAVPKGPSVNPNDKRLAVETEDHPLSYADFEGVIPKGHYGAGVVLIWDKGTFKNKTEKKSKPISLNKAYAEGHIHIELQGKKLKGNFVLRKFKTDNKKTWILIKLNDEHANPDMDIIKKKPKSIVSGLTYEEFLKKHSKQ